MADGTTIMWSPGQIAERDGVSKQAVSKTIAKFVASHDLPVERDARGRIVRVSLAHYDHHRGFFGNSEKTQSRPDPGTPIQASASESRDEALRQQAWLALGRQRLEQAEKIGQLVRADRLADALAVAGRIIQSEISRLQNRADDIALAVSKEGTSGARLLLRQISTEINTRIADALGEVAEAAPAGDEVMDEAEE